MKLRVVFELPEGVKLEIGGVFSGNRWEWKLYGGEEEVRSAAWLIAERFIAAARPFPSSEEA